MFDIKTLIELFDECQIENVVGLLRTRPEKVVFIGFKEVMTKRRINALNDFFTMRGLHIKCEYELVARYDYDAIVEKLNTLLDSNEDCCFDLTGGKELVLSAMGTVSAAREIPAFQINVRTGTFISVENCDDLKITEPSRLTLQECVVLNGGLIINQDGFGPWNMHRDFKHDLESVWRICKKKCGLWNRQSNAFLMLEKIGTIDTNLRVCVKQDQLAACCEEVLLDQRILNELIRNNLILEFVQNEDGLSFRYKNAQVHRCLTKAGNILELYAYMLLREIAEEDAGYYDDIDVGVCVDWDGMIHDAQSNIRDTRNEIDIMLMCDLVPMFISCKNGEVSKEALYELETVADKFGGKYAKKYLLTTYMSAHMESRQYLRQRAIDMGITIIEGVENMSRDEFKRTLKKMIK